MLNFFDDREYFNVDKKLLKKRYHKLLKKKCLSQDDKEDLAVCELLIMELKGKPADALIGFDDNGLYVKW
jgi:hypothetical protein